MTRNDPHYDGYSSYNMVISLTSPSTGDGIVWWCMCCLGTSEAQAGLIIIIIII